MAKFPGVADFIGGAKADPSRPVGSYDVSGFTRGAEKIAEATQALGKGISNLGTGVADYSLDQQRWDYAKAHSDFLTKKIDLDGQYAQSTDYGPDASGKTMSERYQADLTKLKTDSANLIGAPAMKSRFESDISPDMAQAQVRIAAHAKGLMNNAKIAYVGDQGDTLINQAIKAPNEEERSKFIDTHNQLVDGLMISGAVTPVQGSEMKASWAKQYSTAFAAAKTDSDPQAIINHFEAAPGSGADITNRILQVEGEGKNSKSSAAGAGQFIDSTWLDVLKRNRPDLAQGRSDQDLLAMRADKQLGRQMTEAYRSENEAYLAKRGVQATPGAQYLAHFLGPAGAAAVLKADPNQPVQDALTKAVGAKKAADMISSNPTILNGQLAGSVKDWADNKMGGTTPGGKGSIYDILAPDVREQILARARANLQKQNVQDLTSFKQAIEDTQAEANRTGNVTKPLQQSDFIGKLGADIGPKAYQTYASNIQVAKDVTRVATMDPGQMQDLITSYEPKAGSEGFAAQAERQDMVRKAVAHSLKERTDDPAGFAVNRLPGTQEAYKGYSAVLSNPTASEGQRAVAARSFAATTMMEQQGAGIPANQRQILPAADVEHFKTAWQNAATSDDPKARVGLISTIQSQKAMWGDYWPDVVRQMTPSMQPVVRAIAAGADPAAMTRLMSIDPKENPRAILKEQNETKAKDLTTNLNNEMAPFLATMVGNQRDRDFFDYYNLADKLGALYARDGKEAPAAAKAAYDALIGNRYEMRDTYRIPRDAGVSADDVQAGALVAKQQLDKFGVKPAIDDVGGLTNAAADSLDKFKRDGTWVTSPRNDGLNLMYGDKSVRDAKGAPLFLPWAKLAELGGSPENRAAAMKSATEFGVQAP